MSYISTIFVHKMISPQLPTNRLLSDQVCDLIENQIISGEFSVGDKLPTEIELADLYQVSRTVIREALKALKEKGWLKSRAGKGTYVVANTSRGVDSSLDVILRMNPESGFDHLIEVRECLEPEMAAQAALRAKEEQIQELQNLVDIMERALQGGNALNDFLSADYQFHNKLAEASGNPLMAILIKPLGRLMRDQQHFLTYRATDGLQKLVAQHQRIVLTIKDRHPAAAREEMRKHIRQVKQNIQGLQKLDQSPRLSSR